MAFDINQLLESPQFNMGLGLLGASGYSPYPKSFGEILGEGAQFASGRQQQVMQTQAMRESMLAKKRQQEKMAEFQSLFQPASVPMQNAGVAPINTPEGQARSMGLLAQIAPEAYAQQMISQQFASQDTPRVSTSMNDFQALYPDTNVGSPEGRQQYLSFLEQQDPTGGLMEQAQLELTLQQLQNLAEERKSRNETQSQARTATRRAAVTDLSHLAELSEINSRLESTMLETGLPMPEFRRAALGGVQAIQNLLRVDNTRAKQIKADYDRFSKLTTDFVVGSIDRFASTGSMTNSKFDALIQANASVGSSPEANRLIFADNIEAILDAADAEGMDLGSVDKYLKIVSGLRGEAPKAVDYRTMTDDQLMSLDIGSLSEDEAEAINAILDERGY